ncbi:MAG: DUF2214 family protein [Pseudohongiella sp.]|nr:DUF2214 family protein [Pseudohongiella sp.]
MLAAVVGGIHLLFVLALVVGLMVILLASAEQVSQQDLLAIKRVYALTGVAIVLVAIAGVVLWLWVGKPAAFYGNNPVFHAKMGLFMLLCALFSYNAYRVYHLTVDPTAAADTPVRLNTSHLRLQKALIPLLIAIPVLAYLMARGIGY